MFCMKCGTKLPREAEFCMKCGFKMPSQSAAITKNSQIYSASLTEGESKRMKVAFLAIAILLCAVAVVMLYSDSPEENMGEIQEVIVPNQSDKDDIEDEPITFEETRSDMEQDIMIEEETSLFVDDQQNQEDNVKNYDFSQASSVFQDLEIPDFIAFATDGKNSTDPYFILERLASNTYGHHFPESYQNSHGDYIEYLKELGFIAVIDGYEGYYSLEKIVDEKKIIITTFIEYHTDTNSGQVNIQVEYPQHEIQDFQLSSDEIEPQITIIREIYNNTVSQVTNKECISMSFMTGVMFYLKHEGPSLCYISVVAGTDNVVPSRHYYFQDDQLIFAYIEGDDAYRLYFYQEKLFRMRYTDRIGTTENHEYTYSEQYNSMESFALEEARQLKTALQKELDSFEGGV